MNVLILSNNFPPVVGGISNFTQNIAIELVNRCHNVIVLCKWFGYKCVVADSKQIFTVYRYRDFPRLSSFSVIIMTLYLALRKKSTVIFLGEFQSTHGIGAILAKKLFGIPYVILIHGNEMNYYFKLSSIDRRASKRLLRNANLILVNSSATKKLVESYGYSSRSTFIIHPAVDPEKFNPDNNIRLSFKNKYGLNNKKILLTVARLRPLKNHENVIKALPIVIKIVPDLIYLIIGEGEEKSNLLELTKDLGLEEYIRFTGNIDHEDVSNYFNICDVFIMPSKKMEHEYESFGMVFIEANACRKPVIGSKIGGIKEAVIDNVTGLLVDPYDIDEIASAIIRFLTDVEYAKQLGVNGRKRVERELNWEVVGEKVENILEQVISENSATNMKKRIIKHRISE